MPIDVALSSKRVEKEKTPERIARENEASFRCFVF